MPGWCDREAVPWMMASFSAAFCGRLVRWFEFQCLRPATAKVMSVTSFKAFQSIHFPKNEVPNSRRHVFFADCAAFDSADRSLSAFAVLRQHHGHHPGRRSWSPWPLKGLIKSGAFQRFGGSEPERSTILSVLLVTGPSSGHWIPL